MYIKNCDICQKTHTESFKKPFNEQIISSKPRERYVMDLTDIKENINDDKYNFKYIFNIIDHYTKICGSYLLENKKSDSILIALNDFISRYGYPTIIQSDNGKEFRNIKLQEFCEINNIKLYYSKPRHPQTNGIVERLHREIKKSLYVEKIKNGENYNINMAISNAVLAHNANKSRSTKYKPIDLFFNKDEIFLKRL